MLEGKQRSFRERRFWRPRFSLWATLVVVTVVAIPLSYVAQRRSFNLRRKAAYEALTRKGAYLERAIPATDAPGKMFHSWWNALFMEEWAAGVLAAHLPGAQTSAASRFLEIEDSDIRLLARFPELIQVNFSGLARVSDEGLETLTHLPQLRNVFIDQMPGVEGAFLKGFSARENLESLSLGLNDLKAENLADLPTFSRLQHLSLVSDRPLDITSLSEQELPADLKSVRLEFPSPLSDVTLRRWLNRCRLRSLTLRAVSRRGILAMANQVELQDLFIFDSTLLDEDFAVLQHCPKLMQLHLESMPIRGNLLDWIPKPDGLRELILDSTLFHDDELERLSRFKNLTQIHLKWTPISGEGFSSVPTLPQQCDLHLAGTEFSEEGKRSLAALRSSGPGNLREVSLPENWTIEDFELFPREEPPWPISVTPHTARRAWHELGKEVEVQSSGILISWAAPLDNCPADLMAPVNHRRESTLARREAELKESANLKAEIEKFNLDSKRGSDGDQ